MEIYMTYLDRHREWRKLMYDVISSGHDHTKTKWLYTDLGRLLHTTWWVKSKAKQGRSNNLVHSESFTSIAKVVYWWILVKGRFTKWRRHRSSVRQKKRSKSLQDGEGRAKARAFIELVAYMENSIQDGIFFFKLSDLRRLYIDRL